MSSNTSVWVISQIDFVCIIHGKLKNGSKFFLYVSVLSCLPITKNAFKHEN